MYTTRTMAMSNQQQQQRSKSAVPAHKRGQRAAAPASFGRAVELAPKFPAASARVRAA